MSGLAAWLAALGWEVDGCDRSPGGDRHLAELGIEVERGHSSGHVEGASLVIHSAAVDTGCAELESARKLGARVLRRGEALADLCAGRRVLAVAGAHGKTTTTAITGWILQQLGLDPLVLAGGRVRGWQGGFRMGSGVAVIEADEYDRAFLRLPHELAAVTSYDLEHLECYGGPDQLHTAFQIFLELTAPGGSVVVPVENRDLAHWAARIGRRVLTAGPGGDCDCRSRGASSWGEVFDAGGATGLLPVPGLQNLRNLSTAMAALSALGVGTKEAAAAVRGFPGVGRRLERLGRFAGRLIISDYAHHPAEMTASLEALRRACGGESLAVVFEPHLYSRTARLAGEMGTALGLADSSAVLPVFGAREEPLAGVDSSLVVSAARRAGAECSACPPEEVPGFVRSVSAGVVVFMGAGNSDSIARSLPLEPL